MAVEFAKAESGDLQLNLTPLIDIIFQLLVFFMLSSTFLYPSVDMDLPKSELGTGQKKDQRIVVSMTEGKDVFLNSKSVSFADLPAVLKTEIEQSKDKAVYFRADKKVYYENFFEIMELATKAGAEHFHLIHQPG